MANPAEDVGHIVDGIGVPSGNLFDNWQGVYGGYNSSAQGDRNILAMASCEYPGADMDFTYDTPNNENSTGDITYFLALIAEHGEGTVKFRVQTDFESPDITIINAPEVGVADQETMFNINAIDECGVDEVWVEYSSDNGTTSNNISFTKADEIWSGSIPAFEKGSLINYTIWSRDMYGNEGGVSSSFPVKTLLDFNVNIADRTISTGQEVEVEGSLNLCSNTVDAFFIH